MDTRPAPIDPALYEALTDHIGHRVEIATLLQDEASVECIDCTATILAARWDERAAGERECPECLYRYDDLDEGCDACATKKAAPPDDDAKACVYCEEQPRDEGYDRCTLCRTVRDVEDSGDHGASYGGDL